MKKKIISHIHGLKKKSKSIFYVVGLSSFMVVVFIFISARFSAPHTSELNFKEYSMLGEQAGSVIPASCVSGVPYTHPYDINVDQTIDSGCVPVCSAGESLNTTNQYRCKYTKTVSIYNAWLGYFVNGDYTSFSAWQNTVPSCPAGDYPLSIPDSPTTIETFPSGTVQQKDVYSCAVNPVAPTLSSACHYNGASTTVTISWSAVPNATSYDNLSIVDLTSPRICAVPLLGLCFGWVPPAYTPTINPDGLSFDYPIISGYNYTARVSSEPGASAGSLDFSCSQPPSVNLFFTP